MVRPFFTVGMGIIAACLLMGRLDRVSHTPCLATERTRELFPEYVIVFFKKFTKQKTRKLAMRSR